MKLTRTMSALVLSLLLCAAVSFTAFAHIVPDETATGSISVTMTYNNEAVSGGTFTLYRVGEIAEDDGNYSFALTADYADSGVSLDDPTDAAVAEALAAYVEENSLTGTTAEIGEDGTVIVSDLSTGLYLLVQTTAADGFEPVAPFMVSIPVEEDGAYVYDVDATPKVSTLTEAETSSTTSSEDTSSETTSSEATTSEDTSSGSTLPQTGQHNLPVVLLAVSGLCLLLVGVAIRSKSNEA